MKPREVTEYIPVRKSFNFKLIAVGLIFLVDFNINAVDFLPDIIGVALIYRGIGKAFYASGNFSGAKKYINYYFILSLFKLIWNIVYLIRGSLLFESKVSEDSLILLLTSVFALTELFLSIFIFINIIKALDIFFQTDDGDRTEYENKSAFVLLILKVFFVLKFIFGIIAQSPELLTEINLDDLSGMFGVYLDAGSIKSMLTPPCFILQTLSGIFMLAVVMPFFFDIANDEDFCGFVKSRINNRLISDNLFVLKRNLNSGFLFFMTGCVFFADFRIDNINILPDFLICVFFLSGISLILNINPEIKNKKLNIYIIINIFISVFAYISSYAYRITFIGSFTGENREALLFLKASSDISHHISVIIFFLIFIEFYGFIINLQRKHLEFSSGYFNKYIASSEKNFDKNRNKIFIISAAAFCVKTASVILPESGIILFYCGAVLTAFAFFAISRLYIVRNAVYSYYN